MSNTPNMIDGAEYTAATEEAKKTTSGIYVHTFAKPYTFKQTKTGEDGIPRIEDVTVEKLTFNFAKLTGADDLAVEQELQMLGKVVVAAEFSGEYLMRMAAKACTETIGADAIREMPLQDFRKIRSKARSFLLRAEL